MLKHICKLAPGPTVLHSAMSNESVMICLLNLKIKCLKVTLCNKTYKYVYLLSDCNDVWEYLLYRAHLIRIVDCMYNTSWHEALDVNCRGYASCRLLVYSISYFCRTVLLRLIRIIFSWWVTAKTTRHDPPDCLSIYITIDFRGLWVVGGGCGWGGFGRGCWRGVGVGGGGGGWVCVGGGGGGVGLGINSRYVLYPSLLHG